MIPEFGNHLQPEIGSLGMGNQDVRHHPIQLDALRQIHCFDTPSSAVTNTWVYILSKSQIRRASGVPNYFGPGELLDPAMFAEPVFWILAANL